MPSEKEPEKFFLDSHTSLYLGSRFSVSPDFFNMSLTWVFLKFETTTA